MSTDVMSNPSARFAVYGKMPKYGDFLQRQAPAAFVEAWDGWLQDVIEASHEQLGEQWLNHWLATPICRFALSPGVIGEQGWLGILVPSVDRVGRYFPLTLALPITLTSGILMENVFFGQNNWFCKVENIGIDALDPACELDAVLAALAGVGPFQSLMPLSPLAADDAVLDGGVGGFCSVTMDSWRGGEAEMHTRRSLTGMTGPYSLWGALDADSKGWVTAHSGLPGKLAFTAILTQYANQYAQVAESAAPDFSISGDKGMA